MKSKIGLMRMIKKLSKAPLLVWACTENSLLVQEVTYDNFPSIIIDNFYSLINGHINLSFRNICSIVYVYNK